MNKCKILQHVVLSRHSLLPHWVICNNFIFFFSNYLQNILYPDNFTKNVYNLQIENVKKLKKEIFALCLLSLSPIVNKNVSFNLLVSIWLYLLMSFSLSLVCEPVHAVIAWCGKSDEIKWIKWLQRLMAWGWRWLEEELL